MEHGVHKRRWNRFEVTFLIVAVIAAAGLHRRVGWPSAAAMQAILLLTAAASVLSSRAVVTRLLGGGRLFALVGAGLLAGLIAGQVRGDPHDTFPFVPWAMYGVPASADEVVYYDYTLVLNDGSRVEIRPAAVLRTFSSRVTIRLEHLADAMEARRDPETRAALSSNYEAIVRALARRYGRDHPGSRPRAVEVGRNVAPRRGYCGPPCVTRAPFRTVEVEER